MRAWEGGIVELGKPGRTPLPWTRLDVGSPVVLSSNKPGRETPHQGVVCERSEQAICIARERLPEDLAVIDEACQSTEPGCWIPLLRCDRVVLAGVAAHRGQPGRRHRVQQRRHRPGNRYQSCQGRTLQRLAQAA